jgi:hypothetical protein
MKIQSYPRGGEYVDIEEPVEPDPEIEKWLGDDFVSWAPADHELVVVAGHGGRHVILGAGDRMARRRPGGPLYLNRSAVGS